MEKKDLETIIELLLKENKQLKTALEQETKERSLNEEVDIFRKKILKIGLINFNLDYETLAETHEGISTKYTITFKEFKG